MTKISHTTPDGVFTVTLETTISDEGEEVASESLIQVIELLLALAGVFKNMLVTSEATDEN